MTGPSRPVPAWDDHPFGVHQVAVPRVPAACFPGDEFEPQDEFEPRDEFEPPRGAPYVSYRSRTPSWLRGLTLPHRGFGRMDTTDITTPHRFG